jgi:hypothetical protein
VGRWAALLTFSALAAGGGIAMTLADAPMSNASIILCCNVTLTLFQLAGIAYIQLLTLLSTNGHLPGADQHATSATDSLNSNSIQAVQLPEGNASR